MGMGACFGKPAQSIANKKASRRAKRSRKAASKAAAAEAAANGAGADLNHELATSSHGKTSTGGSARISGTGGSVAGFGGRHIKSPSIMSDGAGSAHERGLLRVLATSPPKALDVDTCYHAFLSKHHATGASFRRGESSSSEGTSEEALAAEENGGVGCLSIIDNLVSRGPPAQPPGGPSTQPVRGVSRHRSRRLSGKPEAGCSLARRDINMDWRLVREAYEECDATTFKIRGLEYMKNKQKVPSEKSFYRLVAADMFSFETKTFHIAKMLGHLPTAPAARHMVNTDMDIPPLIIINLQLPTYPPSFFGSNDGPGFSIVYYFALDEDFDPAAVNPKALGLLKRFVTNGREADGASTRDRFKLIPRVVNVEEWATKGPLSSTEYKLLSNYNEKPVLTRPQQAFFHGPNYLEVDLDIHLYNFMARKALQSFFSRLREVVWENAFVIQGDSKDELPEVVLGAARLYRTDFELKRPFSAYTSKATSSTGEGIEASPPIGTRP